MFESFFAKYPDHQIIHKPTQEQIAAYKNVLPEPILDLWNSHGWGVFMNGYLRLIDPSLFQEFTDEYIEQIGLGYTPWAGTVFGDLLVWSSNEDSQCQFYNYRHQDFEVISSNKGLLNLLNNRLCDLDFLNEVLRVPSNFPQVRAELGVPAYDQCYGYFPLLALGGSESVDHIQIVDLQVHMDLMAQVSGPL